MARAFDTASSQYLHYTGTAVSALPFTVSLWAYRTDSSSNMSLWSMGDVSDTNNWINIFWGSGTAAIQLRRRPPGGGTVGPASSSTYGTGSWIHVAGSYVSSNEMHIWVNGSKATDTGSLTNLTLGFLDRTALGVLYRFSIDNHFDGYLADYGMWDVELSDDEVNQLAAGYSARMVRPSSLIEYVPLVRDQDTDWINGQAFTATNTPTVAAHPPIIYPGGGRIAPAGLAATIESISASCNITASADAVLTGGRGGSASISLSTSATLYGVPLISGSVTKRLTATAAASELALADGTSTINLTAVPRLGGIIGADAAVTIALTASAGEQAVGGMAASGDIALTASAGMGGVKDASASAGIVLTARATHAATTSISASASIVLIARGRFDVGCLDARQIEIRPGLVARGVTIGGRLEARPEIIERLDAKGVELCQLRTSTSRQTTLSG